MQVTVESTGTLGRRMTVALPAERLEREFEQRLKNLSRKAKVPGFRPGKVPLKVIEAQYGREVLEEASNELIRSSFYEAAGSQGLKPAGGPSIAPKAPARGQDLEYTAEFEIYPEVRKLDLTGAEIEKPLCEVGDEDIERTLEVMQRQRMTWQDVDRPAARDDRVTIDFIGRIDGTPFEGGEAKGFALVLGAGQLIGGFEEGLEGVRAGEQRRIPVTFPEQYPMERLAGRAAEFEVDVKLVQGPVLPAVDAEFAKALGVEDGSVERLRNEIRSGLQREAEGRVRALVKDRVFKALLEANPGDVPAVLIEQEAVHLMNTTRANMQQQGMPEAQLPGDPGPFRERARSRVALGIILTAIVQQKSLRVEPARLRARVEELAASYESPAEFVRWHYERPERLAEIESSVLEDQVVALLLDSATIREQQVAFRDLGNA